MKPMWSNGSENVAATSSSYGGVPSYRRGQKRGYSFSEFAPSDDEWSNWSSTAGSFDGLLWSNDENDSGSSSDSEAHLFPMSFLSGPGPATLAPSNDAGPDGGTSVDFLLKKTGLKASSSALATDSSNSAVKDTKVSQQNSKQSRTEISRLRPLLKEDRHTACTTCHCTKKTKPGFGLKYWLVCPNHCARGGKLSIFHAHHLTQLGAPHDEKGFLCPVCNECCKCGKPGCIAASKQLKRREKLRASHVDVLDPSIVQQERALFNTLKAFRSALMNKNLTLAESLEKKSTQLLDKLRLKRRKVKSSNGRS